MPGGFGRGPCRFCEREISVCGFGEWRHLQMHYRRVFNEEPPVWMGCWDITDKLLWRERHENQASK